MVGRRRDHRAALPSAFLPRECVSDGSHCALRPCIGYARPQGRGRARNPGVPDPAKERSGSGIGSWWRSLEEMSQPSWRGPWNGAVVAPCSRSPRERQASHYTVAGGGFLNSSAMNSAAPAFDLALGLMVETGSCLGLEADSNRVWAGRQPPPGFSHRLVVDR